MSPDRDVRAVLWDADGVLQHLPGGWHAAMRPVVGDVDVDAFINECFVAERPTLSGEGRWTEVLPAVLERWGLEDRYDDVLGVWCRLEAADETPELVRALRSAGVACHLATNQDEHRGQVMEQLFGYDALFDRCFYSYALGVAKPEPVYFETILREIDVPADATLFIDDNLRNVESARSVGLRAEHWSIDEPVDVLREHLAKHGLPV